MGTSLVSSNPPLDTTLTKSGQAADAKAVGAALGSVKGMFKITKVELLNISVNIDHNDYYYSSPVSFADKIPANAIVLAATSSNWGLTNCGSFSVYISTTDKNIQIMAPKSGNVGALFIDVLYI